MNASSFKLQARKVEYAGQKKSQLILLTNLISITITINVLRGRPE